MEAVMTEPGVALTPTFEGFVRERGGALWWAAWLLTGDAQHAEDLVQTALGKTYGKYASFDNHNHYEAYVRTTIYRTFCSWWRRRSWKSEVPTETLPEGAVGDTSDIRLDVLRALETLPRIQRAALVLRYFEDRPVDEVASLLGLPEGTVRSHCSRGCAALRKSGLLSPEELS